MSDEGRMKLQRRLVDEAASLYRPAGRFARFFARSKYTRDPLYATLLRTGAIPDASCLVDLGCGQGLLAAWLFTARKAWTGGTPWPDNLPVPAKVGTYLGIDRSRADIARAHRALPPFARSFRGDVRTLGPTLLDRCDVATLFDVLHYLAPAAQEQLLASVHAGLPPWGVLLLRVGDPSMSASRRIHVVDLVVGAARGRPRLRLHRRPVARWIALLERIGFVVDVLDDGHANVLLRASRTEAAQAAGSAVPVRSMTAIR
ncbi:MAG: class I SAM-dependent methyltransferase [Burkholderiaceae bacterium]